jgi:hypothetical protein
MPYSASVGTGFSPSGSFSMRVVMVIAGSRKGTPGNETT